MLRLLPPSLSALPASTVPHLVVEAGHNVTSMRRVAGLKKDQRKRVEELLDQRDLANG